MTQINSGTTLAALRPAGGRLSGVSLAAASGDQEGVDLVDDSADIDSIGNAELRGYLARENGRPRDENPFAQLADKLATNGELRARADQLAAAWWRGWGWD